ncbi:polar amino acid transport system ATP-binding protein [Propionibacterium cyclohexanicum]|uniref:Polar amino acid transport system ATP-binding protein n=1 Tax=Propionibacterium cyclohexanicum TaxID=64702 RepID=A0A1H9RYU5_9ACTN|nr:amino acid ABC transporter ATP-binding protein [Propionibacterium cyclohexanicum]SER77897.1 polar amino acid transport system ATP-binding protein [Propionibacterium cyclohexanicum]
MVDSEGGSISGDPAPAPAVRIESVIKSYGDRHVLRNVSAEFRRGEISVILGSSGSGKSTLLRAIAGLTTIDEGKISIDGQLVTDGESVTESWASERRKIGMVFQNYTLWPHLNVRRNLTLAPRKILKLPTEELHQKTLSALASVGMSDYLEAMPLQLSGGQRQRVAIARALMMSPEVLLCDEITSALDPPVAADVLGVLTELRDSNSLCVVLVTHDMSFAAKAADRLLFFHEGNMKLYPGFADAKADKENTELQRFLAASAIN